MKLETEEFYGILSAVFTISAMAILFEYPHGSAGYIVFVWAGITFLLLTLQVIPVNNKKGDKQ
ncbi:MAG: hypothetical protein QXW35_05740 [Candidatus Aenigmatarchaeota archaeon]